MKKSGIIGYIVCFLCGALFSYLYFAPSSNGISAFDGQIIVDMTTFEAYDIKPDDKLHDFMKNKLKEGQNYLIIAKNRKNGYEQNLRIFETVSKERPDCKNATIAITGLENPEACKYNDTETGMNISRFYVLTDEMLEREIEAKKGKVEWHTIYSGETLENISNRYGCALDDVVALNRIDNPDEIYPGKSIRVLRYKFK